MAKMLREKLITYYELILQGKDPSSRRSDFWDEFFLLKANVEFLEGAIMAMSLSNLMQIKANINNLFIQCCRMLQTDDNMIRNINALQTLCVLVQSIYRKHSSSDSSIEVVDILTGVDAADCQMRNLIECLCKFLSEEYPVSVKNLCLKFILIILTSIDNISQNVMLEYFMLNSIFEALVSTFFHPDAQEHHGYDAAVALALLVNYRKHEAANLYVIKLSVLDNEIILNGLGHIISAILTEYIKQYSSSHEEPKSLIGALTSWVGSALMPAEAPPAKVRISEALLLVLYEAVYLNKHFHSVLTHTRSVSTPSTPTSPSPAVHKNLPVPSSPTSTDVASIVPMAAQPMNLLGTFITFTSIIIQNIKDDKGKHNARLCLIILNCIVENSQSTAFLFDPNMTFHIEIHRANLLHRKLKRENSLQSLSMAGSLLELIVEFIVSHLSQNFHSDLYCKCLGIVHRLLCYQKRHKVRLSYSWKELWNALISLVRFFVSNGEKLLPSINIFIPANEVIKLFNLFITYGDTFLPDPTVYDELYYELIRVKTSFDGLYQLALRYSSPGKDQASVANSLTSALYNIRSIANHFAPKIDQCCATNQTTALSTEQVLEVIRNNYDTLTLKLQDGLDQHDKYSEKPKESPYFSQLVRNITSEARKTLVVTSLQQMTILSELSGNV
ncbi:PREDICTED: UPF0668 protein C10orf76 homolog [Amphimedon queenslandica]|uniref:Armadillo-like helical domain-containing protein n=1 Tax=Amphimedon queenslandica TaxID=400682 RepID=A0A1X7VPN1_AMPQE|nr:PREDICTED: UPF0668 protein C10orf76 homolog [Amphimedon queenslandica]|eukprot:XP_019859629.1 PREDICTED: UPF0668 protein C10orf76 homolog [Amphimedon queenslandica]